jgi:hypothetical protein
LDEGGTVSFFDSIDINSSAVFRYAFVILLYYCVDGENPST